MNFLDRLPFRLGTTSYIIPADILPNLRWLSGKVRDVELVLFDVDEYCNIPTDEQIWEMRRLAAESDFSYTVHLPLDLNFSDSAMAPSIEKALSVIRATKGLEPFAWVCHLDSRQISQTGTTPENWCDDRIKAVRQLLETEPIGNKLCVENLENYPPEWNLPVLTSMGTSACLDIGHLWLQGRDVAAILPQWLPKTRVIHLHGIGSRDHQSLRHVPRETLRAVWRELIHQNYRGIVTLEVFNETDLFESLEILEGLTEKI